MSARAIETIPELFDHAVDSVPDAVWVITDEGSWTFGDAARYVDRLAAGLTAAGVGHGDRVIVTARNEPRYLFTWFALMQLGAIQVPLNPASSAAEFEGFVRQVRPVTIVGDADLSDTLGPVAGAAGLLDVDELAATDGSDAPRARVTPDDLAVFIPTSGTTGRSKLVMQTHRAYAWAGSSFPWWMQLDDGDRLMTSLPLFHILSLIHI